MARHTKTLPQVFTLGEFRRWLIEALPGEGVTYYVGHLMCDRQGADENASYLDIMAREILSCAQRQEVHLLQKRIDDHHYEYQAIRTSPRNMALMLKALRRPSSAFETTSGKFKPHVRLVEKEHECLLAANN